MKLSGIDVR